MVDHNDLEYRINRMKEVADKWGLTLIEPLIGEYKIPSKLCEELTAAVSLYVARSLSTRESIMDPSFQHNLDVYRNNRTNVTPNGGLVPKKEYQILYNLTLSAWFAVFNSMISPAPNLIKLVRVTPNIRIKFGMELEDNKRRELNTELPHSDSWVEGPWGYNIFVPLLGDCQRNTLRYYKIPDAGLPASFFDQSSSYLSKKELIHSFMENKSFLPKKGHVYISDYGIIHRTWRSSDSKARVSIDTTVLVGNHEVHADRKVEYLNHTPKIGETEYFKVHKSEMEKANPKKTDFSHYTTGNIELVSI